MQLDKLVLSALFLICTALSVAQSRETRLETVLEPLDGLSTVCGVNTVCIQSSHQILTQQPYIAPRPKPVPSAAKLKEQNPPQLVSSQLLPFLSGWI